MCYFPPTLNTVCFAGINIQLEGVWKWNHVFVPYLCTFGVHTL